MPKLIVENFAQIERAEIEFGDLTLLVGAQGTGKSLLLQWLKVAIDGGEIVSALIDAGQDVSKPRALVDLVFGVGMGDSWSDRSRVAYDGKALKLGAVAKHAKEPGRVFFIPAHRAMLMSDGWAAPFQRLGADVPVVARIFSQALFDRFTSRDAPQLFPLSRVLKAQYRKHIDQAVFHGGTVGVDSDHYQKRLKLNYGETKLPFMTWTAGQREFTPLLLGLYQVLPERQSRKIEHVDWVVIEEPEMGLHPQAVTTFMLLVLDLLWRGYRVVLATHSPLVLMSVWALRQLKDLGAPWWRVCEAFGVGRSAMQKVATAALQKEYRTYLLAFDDQGARVNAKDISSLNPSDEDDAVSGWGGLSGFASRFGEAVRNAAEAAEQ